MNATTFGSVPRGVRATMPITAMRLRPLPAPSPDEVRRIEALLRRRPLPRRAAG
jgi:hypothetical protein